MTSEKKAEPSRKRLATELPFIIVELSRQAQLKGVSRRFRS